MQLHEARAVVAQLRPRIDGFLTARADLAELRADLGAGHSSRFGGLPEAKGLEARLYADLEHFGEAGAQVKGFAPLLLDFPGDVEGTEVLWCWMEGDDEIAWYHRLDAGFAGRRRISR
jgi:hypothetical protein